MSYQAPEGTVKTDFQLKGRAFGNIGNHIKIIENTLFD
jgi:hypothetical protein